MWLGFWSRVAFTSLLTLHGGILNFSHVDYGIRNLNIIGFGLRARNYIMCSTVCSNMTSSRRYPFTLRRHQLLHHLFNQSFASLVRKGFEPLVNCNKLVVKTPSTLLPLSQTICGVALLLAAHFQEIAWGSFSLQPPN